MSVPARPDDAEYTYSVNEDPDCWREDLHGIPFRPAVRAAHHVIDGLRADFGDEGWVEDDDIRYVWTARTEGFQTFLSEYQEDADKHAPREDVRAEIVLPNKTCAIIWFAEITTQISDGAWEWHDWEQDELGIDEWKRLSYADVHVDESRDEAAARNLPDRLQYMDELTESNGHVERMIFYVRAAFPDRADYDKTDLRRDLECIESMNENRL